MKYCARMNSFSLAHAQNIFRDTARSTRGQMFRQIAGKLNRKSLDVRHSADLARDQEEDGIMIDPIDVQNDVMDTLDDTRGDTRKDIDGVFADAVAEGKKKSDILRETAKYLDEAAAGLTEVSARANMENEQHEGDTLAQAELGASGTETGDLEKMQGQDSVIDTEVAIGAIEHEHAHTEQEIQTVQRVSEDAPPDDAPVSNTLDNAPKKGEVTSTQLFEAGAIIRQKQEAPGSFDKLTQVYKDTYRHVLSYVPDENGIVELANQSDGLETLQREYMMA